MSQNRDWQNRDSKNDLFIGRQPIFNRDGVVEAYELLYRPAQKATDSSGMVDGEQATARVLVNVLMHFGIEQVSGGKRLFINGTHDFITGDIPDLLPPETVVLEVLEDIQPDDDVMTALRHWKELGFTIALDDFIYAPHLQPLVDLADLIKVDITVLPHSLAEERERLRSFSGRLLAEKIETIEEHQEAMGLGFDLFQGYYYAKPTTLSNKGMDANQAQAMQMMRQAMEAESAEELEELISRDVAIAYKLLKYINSPAFGLRSEIKSIRHALTLLGLKSVRTWASIVALSSASSNKPDELVRQSLVRGRFLEQLAEESGSRDARSDHFILGMFSLLEAMLDQPMAEAIAELSLPDAVRQGLTDRECALGRLVRLVEAMEQGDWQLIEDLTNEMDLHNASSIYLQAMFWVDELGMV
ncbi:MAG: HDOD domain-containing protein [Mariprofundales bacterium]|nr:HDOD domain-containing protein [Mariprofundales bacterium]